jgi:hypothetical protein
VTKLSYVRLFCDGQGCDETLVLRNQGNIRQLRLAAARHGWLMQTTKELCPACRAKEESMGSTVAQ